MRAVNQSTSVWRNVAMICSGLNFFLSIGASWFQVKPNGIVRPIHPKAMPVILTTPEEYEICLSAPADEALRLQRPLPNDMLKIVAEGSKSDPPEQDDGAKSRSP